MNTKLNLKRKHISRKRRTPKLLPGVRITVIKDAPGAVRPFSAQLHNNGVWKGTFTGKTHSEAKDSALRFANRADMCKISRGSRRRNRYNIRHQVE